MVTFDIKQTCYFRGAACYLRRQNIRTIFPINIRIVKVTEYPVHYHQDVEIIYVLKGVNSSQKYVS